MHSMSLEMDMCLIMLLLMILWRRQQLMRQRRVRARLRLLQVIATALVILGPANRFVFCDLPGPRTRAGASETLRANGSFSDLLCCQQEMSLEEEDSEFSSKSTTTLGKSSYRNGVRRPKKFVAEVDPLLKHYRYAKVKAVFDRLDVGGNGAISFAEFLTQVEMLTPAEINESREAFDMLGPDKDGNVRKRKFIALQIQAFEDVPDAEFDRWVHIMTKGSIIHRHRKQDLLAAGVEIPDDYVDPPAQNIGSMILKAGEIVTDALYHRVFAATIRSTKAAFDSSAIARQQHINRISRFQHQLEKYDKTLLDDEHAHMIEVLEEKNKKSGTMVPPKQRRNKASKRNEARETEFFNAAFREEKSTDHLPRRGMKEGNEMAPLLFETSDARIEQARDAFRTSLDRRFQYRDNERLRRLSIDHEEAFLQPVKEEKEVSRQP